MDKVKPDHWNGPHPHLLSSQTSKVQKSLSITFIFQVTWSPSHIHGSGSSMTHMFIKTGPINQLGHTPGRCNAPPILQCQTSGFQVFVFQHRNWQCYVLVLSESTHCRPSQSTIRLLDLTFTFSFMVLLMQIQSYWSHEFSEWTSSDSISLFINQTQTWW